MPEKKMPKTLDQITRKLLVQNTAVMQRVCSLEIEVGYLDITIILFVIAFTSAKVLVLEI